MEKLTKQDFWDPLYERYPGQVNQFCDWIDQYKERVGWHELFRRPLDEIDNHEITRIWEAVSEIPADQNIEEAKMALEAEETIRRKRSLKYHDLPIAMQWGIFQQFCAENHPSGFGGIASEFEHPGDLDKIPDLISDYFSEMKTKDDIERYEKNTSDYGRMFLPNQECQP